MKLPLLLLLGGLAACGGKGQFECSEDESCPFGETCVEGVCQGQSCNTSIQCPMEHYCGNDRECVAGCESDNDCYPGSSCSEAAVCEEDGCIDTSVDCGYREFCNTATGECYDAGGMYCFPCGDDSECGEGNFCWAGYCGVDCADNECPGGFDCYPVDSGGNITSVDYGDVFAYQCLTYCWLYEDYEPGSFLRGPSGDRAPWRLPEPSTDAAPSAASSTP